MPFSMSYRILGLGGGKLSRGVAAIMYRVSWCAGACSISYTPPIFKDSVGSL